MINTSKNSKDTQKIAITITPGLSTSGIGDLLYSKGLIADKSIFSIYSRIGPSRGSLKPGVYLFSPSMSLASIVDTIGRGDFAVKKVTFQEGLNILEMSKKWAKADLGSAQSFVEASKIKGIYKQTFLNYRSNKDSLEGYLFPSTYDILINSSPEKQINTMLNSFESQVIAKLPAEYQNSSKLNDLVTLASIVEKEANTTEDRKKVASVFYNRLNQGIKLESDVTVNYATGKNQTLPADLSINSPYNTYLVKGLPYGPLCNPSLDAILATANPDSTDYLFFIADKNGVVRFAKTLQEHNQNIEKYLNN